MNDIHISRHGAVHRTLRLRRPQRSVPVRTTGTLRCALMALVLLLGRGIIGQAAELTPQDLRTLRSAENEINSNDYPQAVELLVPLQAKYPDAGDIPRLLVHAYHGLGQHNQARKAAVQAIGAGRLTPDVLVRLAQIDQQIDDRVALLNTVRLLIIIEPAESRWRVVYGELLATSQAYHEAASVFRSLVAERPDAADLHLRLGNILIQLEMTDEAVTSLEMAYHLGATDSQLPLTIAGLWKQLGDARQTLTWLERAAALQDSPSESQQLQIAQLLLDLNNTQRAQAMATELVDSSEQSIRAGAHLLLGHTALAGKDTDTAIKHLQQAADAGHVSAELFTIVGAHHYNRGSFAEAATYLKRAVDAVEQPNEQTLRFLVISFISSGSHMQAYEYLRLYIEHYGVNDEAKKLVQAWRTADDKNAQGIE